jgi:hypothetical protein
MCIIRKTVTNEPISMTEKTDQPKVAIVGGGLAGLTCAAALKGLADVEIFEKSVFVGGRISRYQFGEHRFNHGEQYFTVSNPLFLNIVEAWKSSGLVRAFDGWMVELDRGRISNLENNTQRYTGYPSMQAIADSLAHHCTVHLSTTIAEMEKQANGKWRLFDNRGGYLGMFDFVVLATAAPQTAQLAESSPDIRQKARQIDMTVCWSAMFEFDSSLGLPFDAAFVLDSPLSWISRFQTADEDQETDKERWLMYCSPEWSLEYAASFRGRVMHAMIDAFFEAVDVKPLKPSASGVYCWKHALPINPIDSDSLFDEAARLGACGDWCTAPRIEGAVLSGFSMADRIMKYINRHYDDQ